MCSFQVKKGMDLRMFLTYTNTESNMSINQILKSKFNLSTRLLNKLIKEKKILLNGSIIDTRIIPKINDTITVDLNYEEDNSNILATKMNLDIIYEDKWILVINKPSQTATHPSALHYEDSLSNGVKYYFNSIHLHKKIRPINRLDYNTTGLVIFAKNEYIQECLIQQMKNNSFQKEYLAICSGKFSKDSGTINAPIARKEKSIIERCISPNGQTAITNYEVVKIYDDYTVIKCHLLTGRTHQIRVHMAYINHPLLGDTLYGKASPMISRQALHCYKLSFIHPITKKAVSFLADLPKDFSNILKS